MRYRSVLAVVLIAVVFVQCGKQRSESPDRIPQADTAAIHRDFVRIGTFNIEWLGDGQRDRVDRTSQDYRRIAEVIRQAEFDVLGLQEVENQAALDSLLKYLPGYEGFVGTHRGQQNLAVIYRPASVDVRFVAVYLPLAIRPERDRPGLLVRCRSGNFDWLMMIVHLKSSSRWERTPAKRRLSRKIRQQQARKIVEWAHEVLEQGDEMDLIVVGDFNASPQSRKDRTLQPIVQDTVLHFVTFNLKSCKYRRKGSIDHILVSPSARKRYRKGSARMIDLYAQYDPEVLEKLSDHCPVAADFDVTAPDNDPVTKVVTKER